MGLKVAEAAVTAQENAGSYPFFLISAISILPRPEASADAEPDIPANIKEAKTFTCASPPRKRPTMPSVKSNIFSVILPLFITLAVNKNRGTAIKI